MLLLIPADVNCERSAKGHNIHKFSELERGTLLVEAVVRLSGKGVTIVLSLPLTLNSHRRGFERFIADI